MLISCGDRKERSLPWNPRHALPRPLPLVLCRADRRPLALAHAPQRYDWKEWATSLADITVRRLLALVPYSLAAPVFAWAYEHRLFTLSPDSVGGVLLLFASLEFFYYWFHRSSHTVRWFWNTHSVHHSPNHFTLAAAYRLGWLGKFAGATIFFTPMALLGFEPTTILVALQLNLLYQFWIHAEWIPKLGGLNSSSTRRRRTASITPATPSISTPTTAAC
jgi:sterol desaturase/sphingolipid hydroxylase (fatty acid hydroxylase superfamily)